LEPIQKSDNYVGKRATVQGVGVVDDGHAALGGFGRQVDGVQAAGRAVYPE